MTFQIGRFGWGKFADRDGGRSSLLLPEPARITLDGDLVSVEGTVLATGEGVAPNVFAEIFGPILRRGMTGLLENHEAAVPMWSDNEGQIRGAFRVLAGDVEMTPATYGSYTQGYSQAATYRFTARRVSGGSSALMESRLYGATGGRTISGSHPANDDRFWFGLPHYSATPGVGIETFDGTNIYAAGNAEISNVPNESCSTADGFDCYYFDAVTGGEDASVQYEMPITSWYAGACEIREATVPIVGRSYPFPLGATWAITNGLVKLESPATSGSGYFGKLSVYRDRTKQWELIDNFQIGVGSFPAESKIEGIKIIKNTPVESAIQLTMSLSDGTTKTVQSRRFDVTIRVRRGARFFEVVPSMPADVLWRIRFGTQPTVVDNVFYMYRSANDTLGNRGAVFCVDDNTVTTASGLMVLGTARPNTTFLIAAERGGSAATGFDDILVIEDSVMFSSTESMRVIR